MFNNCNSCRYYLYIMKPQNPYYHQCKFLRYIYPKTATMSNKPVVAWCERFMINIYYLKNKDGTQKLMGCINNSPYIQESTCNGFRSKEKTKQTYLFDKE